MPSATGTSAADAQAKWDRIYRAAPPEAVPEPARVLAENLHLLPREGRALDLASGLGGNALALARRGLETYAHDISGEALVRLDALAARLGLAIATQVRDAGSRPPEAASFDVIVVSRFLDRSLAGALAAALRPDGLLFYQTYTAEKATAGGPSNPAFLLRPNELLELFRGLRIVAYREEGRIGDTGQGFRDEALLVAQQA
jgi:SAM-dependent methyltransferase